MYTTHIVLTAYGTHLHGAAAGSYERFPAGTVALPPDPAREALARQRMSQAPYLFGDAERVVIANAIESACRDWGWVLHALNVRTTHAHLEATSPKPPRPSISSLKGRITMALIRAGLVTRERRVFAEGVSVRAVIGEKAADAVQTYVVARQGTNLAGAYRSGE